MFIVVLSVIVVNSVIAKGPLIFLKLAESSEGAFDGFYHKAATDYDSSTGNTHKQYNYTRFTELYGDAYNLSPRS